MVSSKEKRSNKRISGYFRSRTFQRLTIAILTIALSFIIVWNGAAPKKYKLQLMDKSLYDIDAPRDIENVIKTQEEAEAARKAVPPVMKRLSNVPSDVLSIAYDFHAMVEDARNNVEKRLQEREVNKKSWNYRTVLEEEQEKAIQLLSLRVSEFGIPLSGEQIQYLVAKISDGELADFKDMTVRLIKEAMVEDITQENLAERINSVQNSFQSATMKQELKNIGALLAGSIMQPSSVIDMEATEAAKDEAYRKALEKPVMILKDSRIISVGETITEDKLKVLEDLNLLETSSFDFLFTLGMFTVLLLLSALIILFIRVYCRKVLNNRNEMILLAVIIVFTLTVAMFVSAVNVLIMPVFIAPLLISILLDTKLAIMVNFIITIAVSFMVQGDPTFLYMSMIGGTFAAFAASRANQRSRLTVVGLLLAVINTLIVVCMGMIEKGTLKQILDNSLTVSVNGMISIIFTIGLLPFFESTFSIITPLKLLELANPNQPLIKKLLMEAPGTYHHSLMVGNLAEVAAEAIEANSLLARVGAYFHDVGKLKRPNFFKENQLSDNPHDRMTANLSTLVITSHTSDGLEMAREYKLPTAIKDIICQHHGTTLVVYFYHKAKQNEKGEEVKPEDFRYAGPKPSTKEAAVVMLADSVEAAVRSMVEKTEGKIEGLIRKIIKDKLDDGQLDLCELTLKDLDSIAKSFMRVFSGYFHEREQYPEIKPKMEVKKDLETMEPPESLEESTKKEGSVINVNHH